MNLILVKMFATALALGQVTTRPDAVRTHFDPVADQTEVVQILKDGCTHMRKAFDIEDLKLDGILQIADFHPGYQFADSEPDDIANYSNRSPYPTLHLLREDSIERAVESMPDTASIYENNLETLGKLGHAGWRQLGLKG